MVWGGSFEWRKCIRRGTSGEGGGVHVHYIRMPRLAYQTTVLQRVSGGRRWGGLVVCSGVNVWT